ncbi:biopolymer transporter ExbD [uncultured Paraglaciecola sp.]|uniref:ExbD/TolR family protein n=1 Tax=uncultured Paraglaciecola sp. TaxID=1765024 RepID=UPI0030D9340B|tara:strand:- start:97591 stop:98157 length:567 start_codon:yes stop_codon:yes gene_type:complete
MKQSARSLRMARHHKRMAKDSKLSLVSLMDIFTILVFFLMVNASEVQVLQNSKSVELPESTAQQAAKETLILMVNNNELILQGQKLADVQTILSQSEDIIPALATELAYQVNRTSNSAEKDAEGNDIERAITIMGDKDIPYTLLKRIMQTCAQAGFTNISLAVAGQEPAVPQGERAVVDDMNAQGEAL